MKKTIAFLLLIALLFCGCYKNQERPEDALYVYCLNLQGSALLTEDYVPQEKTPMKQVTELLARMETVESTDKVSVLAGRFAVNTDQTGMNGSILKLYLEGNRGDLAYQAYLLTLSALTRTLTQVEGVDALLVYINGEAVTDNSGRTFGLMRPAMFVNNAGREESDYRVSDMKLYFANETGTRLLEVEKSVRDSSNVSPERTVIRQLLAGPDPGEGYAVVPSGASLLSISTRDGICYLNFDETFVSDMEAGREELAIYAIVNSLTSLEGIEQVQFAINSSTDVELGLSKLSLAEPFSFNSDIVEIKE
ncbi:MAG: GerMN domain-containing protein [Lachnospiraceae bacterium]|nr:GerMN domain-containing protein [Lachnospiraceae bacterium]